MRKPSLRDGASQKTRRRTLREFSFSATREVRGMSDAERVRELLHSRVPAVAEYLYPNGRREGKHWRVGNIEGEAGKSFDICIDGPNAGFWGDFADSQKHSR